MTKVSVTEAREALKRAVPSRHERIELVTGRLGSGAMDEPYPAHREAFRLIREGGNEWMPQAFLLNLEGDLLATYVLPGEGGIKSFLEQHGDEMVPDKYTPLWVGLFPFTYSWREVHRVHIVVDTWMTNTETGRRIEALTVHDMTPTRVATQVLPYTLKQTAFSTLTFLDDEAMNDDATMQGPLMDTLQAAIEARLDVQGQSLPAWFATSVLADCGYDVLLFPDAWPSLDDTNFDNMNDLNSIMFDLIQEARHGR